MTASFSIRTTSQEDTALVGGALARVCEAGDCIVLTGDLGAGKTHFAQGFARELGITGAVSSPTFNLVLEYEQGRIPFYHFDLYRLETGDQLEDIDFYQLVESDGVSLVEWGDKFEEAIEAADAVIALEVLGESDRMLSIRSLTARGDTLVAAFESEVSRG